MSESPYSRVHCIVVGADIGARQCVDRQSSDKCFCPKAPLAIGAVKPSVLPGTRLEDVIVTLTSRARSLITAPNDERFLGPAAEAHRTGRPVAQSLISGTLPEAVKKSQMETYREQAKEQTSDAPPPRPRAFVAETALDKPARKVAPRPPTAEIAAAVLAQHAPAPRPLSIHSVGPAPAPAKEKSMAQCSTCKKSIRTNRDGTVPEQCFRCRLKAGEVSDHKPKAAPVRVAAPRKPKLNGKPRPMPEPARAQPAPASPPPNAFQVSEVLAGVQTAINAIKALPLSAQQFVLNLVNEERIAQLQAAHPQLPAHGSAD